MPHKNIFFKSPSRNILKKIYLVADKFLKKKNFLFEKKDHNKSTFFHQLILKIQINFFYLDGNFESEKYFIENKNEILKEFTFKK